MKTFGATDIGKPGHRLTKAAAGMALALGVAASPSSAIAAAGNLKSMSMQLTAGGGIPGPLRVVSEDQQSWTAIKPGTELLLEGPVKIEMSTGNIDAFGIYWGECSGNDCWQMFEGWKTPLIYSDFIAADVESINKWVIFQFPTSKILVTSPQGIAPSPYGDQIIAQCNAALSNGGDIQQGHSFDFTMPVTLAVDADTGADLTQATSGLTPLNEVDYAKKIDVTVPVICEPVPQSPGASTNVGATLPPFEVLAATLHGSPSSHEGACPVDLRLFMSAKSNIKGPFEARVEAKSGWKSTKYAFQTTETNPDGTWSKHFQDTLVVPIVAAPNQSGGGGAGAAAAGIGQFGTVQPDPEIVFPGSSQTPSASGQVQTGFNPGNLHEDSLRLNVSGGGKTVVSDWWKYSVTCDPEAETFADKIPQTLGQPVVVEQAFLATFPEAPTDGSKCGLSVSGLIQTNVKNATVKFRLRNHLGNATGWQTVQTSHANNIGQFVEYLDFSSSGQGVWVAPGGGWALPGAGAGSQAGRKAGTLQIVTEQPTVFEGNVASYDFACHDPAPTGLGTAPTVTLNPDLPDASGDLVGRQPGPDIVWVQQRLLDLGYREVGKADGAVGRRTRSAILAFKADNGLPRTPEIDAAVVQALLVAQPRRRQADRQAEEPSGARRTSEPRRVVVTPAAPDISCEGGAVRDGRCACRRGARPVKTGRNSFQCKFVAVDPPIAPGPRRIAVPAAVCEGGRVRGGRCICPRNSSFRGGRCRVDVVERRAPQRVSPQRVGPQRIGPQRVGPQRVGPLRVAPEPRRTP